MDGATVRDAGPGPGGAVEGSAGMGGPDGLCGRPGGGADGVGLGCHDHGSRQPHPAAGADIGPGANPGPALPGTGGGGVDAVGGRDDRPGPYAGADPAPAIDDGAGARLLRDADAGGRGLRLAGADDAAADPNPDLLDTRAGQQVRVEDAVTDKPLPRIVCLCGSTRFWREFQAASLRETLAGRIVLSIGAASGTDDEHLGNLPRDEYDRIKAELDELHLRKIEMADEVLVLNKGGYVGESTAREVRHAIALGKPLRWLEGGRRVPEWVREEARP